MEFKGHGDQSYGHITYAQTGEDLIVCSLLCRLLKIEKPSYLDVGAHHPFNISNTALLYKRGCRGVNVEANPNLINEFKIHRPEDINLCVGVVPNEDTKKATLHCFDDWSGRNSLVDGYLESDPFGPLPERGKIEVPVTTINQIVKDYCKGKFPEFLSVDVEGLDYEILKSADFEKYGAPKIICVEALPYREPEKIIDLLDKKGFVPVLRLAVNLLFVHKDIYSIVTR